MKKIYSIFSNGICKAGLLGLLLVNNSFYGFGQLADSNFPGNSLAAQTDLFPFKTLSKGGTKMENPVSANARSAPYNSLPQNSMIYSKNQTSGAWVLDANARYTYDAQGNQTSFTRSFVSSWQHLAKDSMLFNAQGDKIFEASYSLMAPQTNWEINYGIRYIYTYNSAGNPTELLQEEWNIQTNTWGPRYKFSTSYNANNFPTEEISYTWINNGWQPVLKNIYGYAVPTNPPTSITRETYNNGQWGVLARFKNLSWHNFSKNQFLGYESELWTGTAWVNYKKEITIYGTTGTTETIEQDWNGQTWVNTSRNTRTYDFNMNFIGIKEELWVNSTWQARHEWIDDLTYNGSNQVIERITRTKTGGSNTWVDLKKKCILTLKF